MRVFGASRNQRIFAFASKRLLIAMVLTAGGTGTTRKANWNHSHRTSHLIVLGKIPDAGPRCYAVTGELPENVYESSHGD